MLLRECGPRGAPVGWPERNSAEHVVPPAARGASHTAGELRAAWRGCGVVLPSGAASAAASPPRPEGGGTAGAPAEGAGGGAAAGRVPAAASNGGKAASSTMPRWRGGSGRGGRWVVWCDIWERAFSCVGGAARV
jgi:hypothetical protein